VKRKWPKSKPLKMCLLHPRALAYDGASCPLCEMIAEFKPKNSPGPKVKDGKYFQEFLRKKYLQFQKGVK
jgi:hypothetical protein